MSLRIMAPAAALEAVANEKASSSSVDHYLERLVKLVPAESIAAYPLLQSLATQQGAWAGIFVSWLLLGLTIWLRWYSTRTGSESAQWSAILIASVSYVIWVYVMQGHFGVISVMRSIGLGELGETLGGASGFLAVVFLVVWTIIVPTIYQGDDG